MLSKPVFFAVFIATTSLLLALLYYFSFTLILFDFSSILPIWKLVSTYFFISLLVTFCFVYFIKISNRKNLWVFNLIFSVISFFSVIYPFQAKVFHQYEDFFPAFVIPLHFILPLFWLTFHNLLLPHEKK